MEFFAFTNEDLSTDFILSEKLKQVENDFYSEEPGNYWDRTDSQSYLIEDPSFIKGYDKSHENKRYISTNLLAKLLFHREIKQMEGMGAIKPVTEQELEQITRKLVDHQIRLYGKLDPESYYWVWNKAKEDLLHILTAEDEQKALQLIKESIFFTNAEKQMAENIIDKKGDYLCSHIGIAIAEEAVKQNTPPNSRVHIRQGYFKKTYRVSPLAYRDYIETLISRAIQLEKKLITNWENFTEEDEKKLEEIKNILSKIAQIDKGNATYNGKNTKAYLSYLYSKQVLREVLGTDKLEEIRIGKGEDIDWYLVKKHLWVMIRNAPIRILTYTMDKSEPSKLIRTMIIKRYHLEIKTLKQLSPEERKKYLKETGYNKYTLKSIKKILQEENRKLIENLPLEAKKRLEWIKYYEKIGSVSQTCKKFGTSKTTFYRWKRRYEKYGLKGLIGKANH